MSAVTGATMMASISSLFTPLRSNARFAASAAIVEALSPSPVK